MEISPLQRHVQAADLPLDKLAANSNLSQADKVGEVSRQFEAILLRQILSEAQKPVFKSKMNPDTASSGIYRDMITTQLADSISRSKALGLADTLSRQLTKQLKLGGEAKPAAADSSAPTSHE